MSALRKLLIGSVAVLLASEGCAQGQAPRRVVPSYDALTGRLVRLTADQNGDGRADQWTYVDGNRALRGETDADADGRIDRWEYFGEGSALVLIGTSSRADGIEDTWTRPQPTADGEVHVSTSRQRDRHVDRHEYSRAGALVRVEEDTDADGRIDKWERFESGVLREASFDTSFADGRPDRRVTYDTNGNSVVEEDPERDGTFVRVKGAAAPPPARTPGAVR